MNVVKIGLVCAMGVALLAGCKTPPRPGTVCIGIEGECSDPAFAEQVRSAMSERASARGYQPADEGAAVFEVWFTASAKEKAKLDDWFVMEGTAKAYLSVWTPEDYRHFEKTFTAEGPRKLGKDAATKELAGPLATRVFDWAEKTLQKGM